MSIAIRISEASDILYMQRRLMNSDKKKYHKDALDGIDNFAAEITVAELVDKYIGLRRDLKQNSMRAYGSGINRIHAATFGQRKIKTVKKSDAMAFLISLHDEGLKQNTIGIVHNILRPAFEMAVEDDAIRKNPFKFKLCEIIPNDADKRTALTKSQQELYLSFIRDYGNDNYFDDIEILLYTRLRVSELYGLTTVITPSVRRGPGLHQLPGVLR